MKPIHRHVAEHEGILRAHNVPEGRIVVLCAEYRDTLTQVEKQAYERGVEEGKRMERERLRELMPEAFGEIELIEFFNTPPPENNPPTP